MSQTKATKETGENTVDPQQIYADASDQRTILIGQSENSTNSNAVPTGFGHALHRVTTQP